MKPRLIVLSCAVSMFLGFDVSQFYWHYQFLKVQQSLFRLIEASNGLAEQNDRLKAADAELKQADANLKRECSEYRNTCEKALHLKPFINTCESAPVSCAWQEGKRICVSIGAP